MTLILNDVFRVRIMPHLLAHKYLSHFSPWRSCGLEYNRTVITLFITVRYVLVKFTDRYYFSPNRNLDGTSPMFIRRAGDVGALVRSQRKAANLTQGELAERLGTSQRWVSELERGKATIELEMALRALTALGVTLSAAPPSSEAPAGEAKLKPSSRNTRMSEASRPRINVNDLVDD